jgi:beta-lactamase superfamily II metal-dependent hydrolase
MSRTLLGLRRSAWFVLLGIALYTVLVGAKSSSTAPFLGAVRPSYIVVSAGEGNRYGHPSQELMRKAANVGAAV